MTIQGTMQQYADGESAFPRPAMPSKYSIDETYWGYVVRSTEPAPVYLLLAQAAAWLVGIAFLIATLALWLMPNSMTNDAVLGMKFGASVVTIALATFCLWFASRGTDSEIQIDTRLGEVREVVRNRTGRSTLLGRYGFDAIGSVFIDVGANRARTDTSQGDLVLRYRNTPQTLFVASGPMSGLGPLRDRIGRDLMVTPRSKRSLNVPMPTFGS